MSDSFLEEQLRRIRQLGERMSQVTAHRADEEAARERQYSHGPLREIRDVRIVNSVPDKATASDMRRTSRRRRRR